MQLPSAPVGGKATNAPRGGTVYSTPRWGAKDFEADIRRLRAQQASPGDLSSSGRLTDRLNAAPAASMRTAQQGFSTSGLRGRSAGSGMVTSTSGDPDPAQNRGKTLRHFRISGTYGAPRDARIAIASLRPMLRSHYLYSDGIGRSHGREANSKNDAQLIKQDNNWLAFGWWLDEPAKTGPGGEYLYNARVFYDGANVFPLGTVGTDSSGVADLGRLNLTYNGPAAGLYARKADTDEGIASARGEFMADATLSARFGLVDGAANVGGTIDNFTNSDGVDMSAWALTLGRTTVIAIGTGSGATGGDVMSGTATNVAGTWEYQLYGPHSGSKYPSGIAGRFFAAIDGNTAVAGGFGAER